MDQLLEAAAGIAIAIIAFEMLLSLLPEGNMKKFTRFTAGVLLMCMIVLPFKGCVNTRFSLSIEEQDAQNVTKNNYEDIIWDVYNREIENKNEPSDKG